MSLTQSNVFYDSLCVKESYGTFEITFTEVSQVANLLPISNKISIDKNKQLYYSSFFYIDVLFKDNHKLCLEGNTERSESNPGRSLGIKAMTRRAVWKTVPTKNGSYHSLVKSEK